MPVYECDAALANAVDNFDGRAFGDESNVQEILRTKVWPFVLSQTSAGKKLKAEYAISDALRSRVASEMARRFGVTGELRGGLKNPGVWFASRIEQVIGDLIATKDPCLTPIEDVEQPTIVEPTDAEKFAALVAQCHEDMANPAISTVEINKKKQNLEYRKAFERATLEGRAAFMGKSLEPEVKEEAPAKVKQFAHLLNAEIQARGTPKMNAGFVTLRANGTDYKYPVAEFQALTEEAVKFGLIL